MNFSTLQTGTATERRLTVDTPRTISFLGEDLRIYATPRLVDDIEQTSTKARTPSAQRSIFATSVRRCWACR
jgi:hypothetical protein